MTTSTGRASNATFRSIGMNCAAPAAMTAPMRAPQVRPIRKILWAVDALDAPHDMSTVSAVQTVETLAQTTGAEVEPLYLLNHEAQGLLPGDPLEEPENYKHFTERQLSRKLRPLPFLHGKRPTVLPQIGSSMSQSVAALTNYAKNSRSDLIVVYTHGRTGFTRLVSGSFAESLIQHSTVPLFVINPHCRPVAEFKRILFATDFSRSSGKAFMQAVDFASHVKARLTILHAVPTFSQPIVSTGVSLLSTGWIPPEAYITKDTSARRRRADLWACIARRRGVVTDVDIQPNVTSVTEAILQQANDKQVDLISMCAQSDALTTALLGSVTRNIVRQAQCPVWVIRHVA